MKIVYIVPGSGGTFYCENCMRDSSQVKALRALGHDVIMVPMYLPMFTDDPEISGDVPVFFGGINVYLQQKFALFRRTPRWLDRLIDARWLLKLAARQAGSTRATGLSDMTLSMIRGEEGNQAKELDRLITWLAEHEQPDLIHLSNALLIGLARRLKHELKVPVVCSLQDEDTWIDVMPDADRKACWQAISERADDVDAFIAVSHYYAELIRQRMTIPEERLHVMYLGTEPEGHTPARIPFDPPVIGYLSRLCAAQGLAVLVDAFILLKQDPRFANARLHVTGGQTGDDSKLVDGLLRKLARRGFAEDVAILPEFDREKRMEFLAALTVMAVPVPEGEAFGLFVIEAMASGVPLVQPRCGSFPELIELTGGGMLYEPNTAEGLAEALARALADPDGVRQMGGKARTGFQEHFTADHMARKMIGLYERVCSG